MVKDNYMTKRLSSARLDQGEISLKSIISKTTDINIQFLNELTAFLPKHKVGVWFPYRGQCLLQSGIQILVV